MNLIDFLPKRIRHQRSAYRHLRRQGLALTLVVVVLGGVGYFNELRIANAQSDLMAQQNRADALAATLTVLPELTAQLADGQIKARISRELGSRLTINALLAEVGRLLPPSSCLTSLECSTIDAVAQFAGRQKSQQARKQGRDEAVSPTRKRVRLVVTGLAPTAIDVADFIGRLSASPLFCDIRMGYAKTVVIERENRKARSFEVTFLVAE